MEFFEEITAADIDIELLQQRLQIATMPDYCESIDKVLSDQGSTGEIYCLWGQFTVSRDAIKNGVRFALLNCPHALAWTVAFHAQRRQLVVHCTIDDRDEAPEFVETIEMFVAEWAAGLKQRLM